jgi:hypothetical protein
LVFQTFQISSRASKLSFRPAIDVGLNGWLGSEATGRARVFFVPAASRGISGFFRPLVVGWRYNFVELCKASHVWEPRLSVATIVRWLYSN